MEGNAIINYFLNERFQLINANGEFLDSTEVKRNVPQGTVVGPVLFNSSINDIQKRISGECFLVQYADECMIFASYLTSNDALNQLQRDFLELSKLFSTH